MIDEDWKSAREERSFQIKRSAKGVQAAHVWHCCCLTGQGRSLWSCRRKYLQSPQHSTASTHQLLPSRPPCTPSSLSHIDPSVPLSCTLEFIFVPGSKLHISYFHLWSHTASKSPWEVAPFWGARGLTSVVLLLFKQFLIRPRKKDLEGEVGAELGKGDFSSDCFNRLLAGVWGVRCGLRAAAPRGMSCHGEASILTWNKIVPVFTGPSRQEKKIR